MAARLATLDLLFPQVGQERISTFMVISKVLKLLQRAMIGILHAIFAL